MHDTSLDVDAVDDAELVRCAQSGDVAAMEQLLTRHFGYVHNLCRRMLRDPTDAEDARQEALIQAARMITTFGGRSSFRTWLHALTRNVCLNAIRSASRRPVPVHYEVSGEFEVGQAKDPAWDPGFDPYERSTELLDVTAALEAVNPVYRDALVLWFIADLDYEQIAQTLGIPINTVRSRLRRGKAELARLVREPDTSPVVSQPSTAESDPSGVGRIEPSGDDGRP